MARRITRVALLVVAACSSTRSTPPRPQPTAHGFFCMTSAAHPGVDLCTRAEPECSGSRTRILAAHPDLTPCTSAPTAYCHDSSSGEACAPTLATCNTARTLTSDRVTVCELRR